MNPKIKNILIIIALLALAGGIYFFFLRPAPAVPSLATSAGAPVSASPSGSQVGQEFLTLLLNLKTITLNDAIFSKPAFKDLQDYTITLVPEGNEGRVNPFAPIGVESTDNATSTISITTGR
jgi:hypothetical protein